MLVQTVSALGVVLALILLLRALFRASGFASMNVGRRSLRVLESVPLGSGQRLHVIEVEGERLLIGSTEGSVRTLHSMGPVESANDEAEREGNIAVPAASKIWLRLIGRTATVLGLSILLGPGEASAETAPTFTISIDGMTDPQQVSSTLKILGLMTIISMAPAILLMEADDAAAFLQRPGRNGFPSQKKKESCPPTKS